MKKSIGSVFLAFMFLTILLSGCASASTPVPPTLTPIPPTFTPIPTNTLAPTNTPTPAPIVILPNEPVRIAYLLAETGNAAALGIDAKRGIEIAIADKKNTLLGHPIEIVGQDDQCNADAGKRGASELSMDPNIVAVIGASCSSASEAAIEIFTNLGLVLISPSSTNPKLTDQQLQTGYFLRTIPSDSFQAFALAQYAYNRLGVRTMATIYQADSPYSAYVQQSACDMFTLMGGTCIAQESIEGNNADLQSVLNRIAGLSPQLLYYPVNLPYAVEVTQKSKTTPGLEQIVLAASDAVFSPEFLAQSGENALNVLLSAPMYEGDRASNNYQVFLSKYKKLYRESPLDFSHGYAYDAAMMIFNAIEKVAVQDADGTIHIDRLMLRNALFTTQNYNGVTGKLSCSLTGECASPEFGGAVFEIQSTNPANWNPGTSRTSNPVRVLP